MMDTPTVANLARAQAALGIVVASLGDQDITQRIVRNALALQLGLPETGLDSKAWKAALKPLIKQEVTGEGLASAEATKGEPSAAPADSVDQEIVQKPAGASESKTAISAKASKDDEEASPDLSKPKNINQSKRKSAGLLFLDDAAAESEPTQEADISNAGGKASLAASSSIQAQKDLDNDGYSSMEPTPEKPSRKKRKMSPAGMKAEKRRQTRSSMSSGVSPAEEYVNELKRMVAAAGSRRQWKHLFLGFEEDYRKQAGIIKGVLSDIGIKGEPTLAKAKKLKEANDQRRELADIQKIDHEHGANAPPTIGQLKRRGEFAGGGEYRDIDLDVPEPQIWSNGKLVVPTRSADLYDFLGDNEESD